MTTVVQFPVSHQLQERIDSLCETFPGLSQEQAREIFEQSEMKQRARAHLSPDDRREEWFRECYESERSGGRDIGSFDWYRAALRKAVLG